MGQVFGLNATKRVKGMTVRSGLSMTSERNGLAWMGIKHWPRVPVRANLKHPVAQFTPLQRMSVGTTRALAASTSTLVTFASLWREKPTS